MHPPVSPNDDRLSSTPQPAVIFGESANTTPLGDASNPDKPAPIQPPPAASNVQSVASWISQHPLLAMAAVGAVGLVAVVALRKDTRSGTGTSRKHVARYASLLEQAAKREYRRSGADKRVANLSSAIQGIDLQQVATQVVDQVRRIAATAKR